MRATTEQANEKTRDIDRLPTIEMMKLINAEDATVAAAVGRAIPQIAQAVDLIVAALEDDGRLFYVGAGTSGRLGVLDAVECVPTFSVAPDLVQGVLAGGPEAMMNSVEGAEDSPEIGAQDLADRGLTSRDVVCGVAASGRTPYVIGALQYARSIRAGTIAISANRGGDILNYAEVGIVAEVGPEIIAGSTRLKAGSAQKMILNMLSSGSMIKLGKVYGNLMVDVKVSNQKLAERALRLVMELADSDESRASQLLAGADDEVKTAIVMGTLQIDAVQARARLQEANGHLRAVIGDRT